jgi:hypothetical protein
MDNKLSNVYIENAIEELVRLIGIKEPVSIEDFNNINKPNVKEAIKSIAQQLGLPIAVNIVNVANDYRSQHGDNQFYSTHLVKKHESGAEGITAQVLIPSYLPMYGSSALKDFPITVKISENCTENLSVFTSVMAHELSHVLLYSLNHPHKENEFYTDLTAMMLGFKNIFSNGRKVTNTKTTNEYVIFATITTKETTTTTYGYLNDEQFDFAFNKINLILENYKGKKNRLFHKITKLIDALSKYERSLCTLQRRLDFLTKHTNVKISSTDGKRITDFFQPGYIEGYQPSMNYTKTKLKDRQFFLKNLTHFTNKTMDGIENYSKELTVYSEQLKKNQLIIKKDNKTLWKYVGYRYWINIFYNRFFNGNKR